MPTALYQDEALLGLLPLTVRPRPHERAVALLGRLAVRRGSSSLRGFVRGLVHFPYFTLNAVAAGRKLDVVSRLSGFPEEDLRRATPVRTDAGFVIGGVLIERAGRLIPGRSNGRVCPACLAEDLDRWDGPDDCRPHRRFWWDLEEVNGCPDHGVPLLASCPGCRAPMHRVNLRPDRCACGFNLASATTGPAVEGFDEVLTGVMMGRPRPAWAEGLTVRSMSGLALRLGMLAELGPRRVVPAHLDAARRMRLSADGAEILGGGGASVRRVLDAAAARGQARTPGQLYGSLWSWLDVTDDPALGPFKRGLVEHARSALRNAEPVVFWGERIEPGGGEAAPGGAGGDPTFASWVEDLQARRLGGRLEDLALAIGTTAGRLNGVHDEAAGERLPGAVRGDWASYRYDVPGVVAFMAMAALAPTFGSVPPGMVEVLGPRGVKFRWTVAYRALRAGKLRVAGLLAGRVGLPALLVDRAELMLACPPAREKWSEPTLSVLETASRLRVSRKTITALVKARKLETGWRGSASNRSVPAPTLASIERFERAWITASEIHRLTGRSFKRIADALAAAGLESVVECRPCVIPVFARQAALRCFGMAPESDAA